MCGKNVEFFTKTAITVSCCGVWFANWIFANAQFSTACCSLRSGRRCSHDWLVLGFSFHTVLSFLPCRFLELGRMKSSPYSWSGAALSLSTQQGPQLGFSSVVKSPQSLLSARKGEQMAVHGVRRAEERLQRTQMLAGVSQPSPLIGFWDRFILEERKTQLMKLWTKFSHESQS